ncbi:MAG: hypothetical protein NT165_03615 [Candidatus Falkowbacteria bacterium]|nr:hypothetical protein [Candidatus Falkowbacteria bacterium]
MKKTLFLVLIIITLAGCSRNGLITDKQVDKASSTSQYSEINSDVLPKFTDYSIRNNLGDDLPKINKIDLGNNSKANQFRTILNNTIGSDSNFAFHYKIVSIGCGTMCQSIAVIDSTDGKVYFPNVGSALGSKYKPESKLLIVNDPYDIYEFYGNDLSKRPDWMTTSYYVWENNDFRLLKEVRIKYQVEDVSSSTATMPKSDENKIITSQNGEFSAFTKDAENIVYDPVDSVNFNEIWISNLKSKKDRILIKSGKIKDLKIANVNKDNFPFDEIRNLILSDFSIDGNYLYFSSAAWTTSEAVFSVNIKTDDIRFITDSNYVEVVKNGKYKGMLITNHHRYYKDKEGSYDHYYITDPKTGEDVKELGENIDFK